MISKATSIPPRIPINLVWLAARESLASSFSRCGGCFSTNHWTNNIELAEVILGIGGGPAVLFK